MKEVILHVGMPKTGSSSIQRTLKNFDDGKTRYARFREENHSIPMWTIFSSDRYMYDLWAKQGLSHQAIDLIKDEYRKILDSELADCNYERLIISGEDISDLRPEEKKDLLKYLHEKDIIVKVIGFARNPQDFAASSLQQFVRGGAFDVDGIFPMYFNRFAPFYNNLPSNNVVVRDFDEINVRYGDIVKGFADLIAIDIKRLQTKKINESLSETAVKLIYRLNRLPVETFGSTDRYKARERFISIVSSAFPPGSGESKLKHDFITRLLDSSVNRGIDFLKNKYNIEYERIEQDRDPESVAAYLDDLSDLDVSRVHSVLEKVGVGYLKSDSIDSLLISLYMSLISKSRLIDADADYLRDMAVKIDQSKELSLKDALSLLSLAKRARSQNSFVLNLVASTVGAIGTVFRGRDGNPACEPEPAGVRLLNPEGPQAKALDYTDNVIGAKPEAKAKQPASGTKDQTCVTCRLYAGGDNAEWGGCAIFSYRTAPGTHSNWVVSANGWCKAWGPRARPHTPR